jgi:hypothetical protein
MKNWVTNSINEFLKKKSTSLSSIKDNNGLLWFASGNCEENIVDVYVEHDNTFKYFCEIEGDEKFGSHVNLCVINGKLFLCVASNCDLFIYEYDNNEWNKNAIKKYSFDKKIDELIFESALFIRQNTSLKLIKIIDGAFYDNVNDCDIVVDNI